METMNELVQQAIDKYGSILKAPENCEEFLRIREISPDTIKRGTPEYEAEKAETKAKFLRKAERERKILDLIDLGYTADMVASEVGWNVYTVREIAKEYGVHNFGVFFRWHAERNGVQYYSTRKQDLRDRNFKPSEIEKLTNLIKCDLPYMAHYCENGHWHIWRSEKRLETKK